MAKEVQNGVHGATGNDEVIGWDNQLSNGFIIQHANVQLQYLIILHTDTLFKWIFWLLVNYIFLDFFRNA